MRASWKETLLLSLSPFLWLREEAREALFSKTLFLKLIKISNVI